MQFSILKNELYSTLQVVARSISPNSPQPALRGIKIDAQSDKLVITGSDADLSIRKNITKNEENHLNIQQEGSILVESRYLLEIVRKIDSEDIDVEVIDGTLTKFSGGNAQFKINAMNPKDYPNIDFSKPDNSFSMKTGEFSEIIDQTAFATSAKETRPVLTGVNFALNSGKLTCTATDSYRLSQKTVEFGNNGSFNITIPAKNLNELKATLLTEESDIEINISDRKAQFISNDTTLQTRLLEGAYPETEKLIPNEFSSTLSIDRYDLMHAIDRSMFIKTDNMTINRLQCSNDEIVLTNKNQEIGESIEPLSGTYEGDALDISFSGNYVLDALKALKGTTVKLKFTGQMRPFIIVDDNDNSITELVLPVRTYN